jgi:hypothetical protein
VRKRLMWGIQFPPTEKGGLPSCHPQKSKRDAIGVRDAMVAPEFQKDHPIVRVLVLR